MRILTASPCLVFSYGLILFAAPSFPALAATVPARQAASPELVRAYGRLPLSFEKNIGQSDDQVRFLSRGAGYSLFITDTETVAVLQRDGSARHHDPAAVIRLRLAEANQHPRMEGEDLLPGRSNYFIGNDSSKWRTGVAQFAKVRLSDVYRGIDVVYYGNQQQLEYDFVVRPEADPRQIRFVVEGAERVEVDPSGDLLMHVHGGILRQQQPVVYQQGSDGSRQLVAAHYRRRGANEFGVDVAAYDAARSLIIDPSLVYSTYLGGAGNDQANAIAVDASGNAYIAGDTASANFPTMNPLQSAYGGGTYDAFVAKLNAAGALVYSTYLGGSGGDSGNGIAVDTSGNAYLTGNTVSTNFPTMNPLQPAFSGTIDAYVTKLSATGSALVYSTYLGGSGGQQGKAIAVDTSGSAYVLGFTSSTDFPTVNPLQPINGGFNAFVSKLNAGGSALVYSTYLGGSGSDLASRIAVDASGDAYVAGSTSSTDFPTTTNSLQPARGGGAFDAFVAELNAAGSALVYSTYLGGSDEDFGFGLAVDGSGNAYVAGVTLSTDFPTMNPLQPASGGVDDAFVTKLNAGGSALVYSTYLGGSSSDGANGIAVDAAGTAYVGGRTSSTDFPTMNPVQALFGGISDAFVAKLNSAGSAVVDSTYLGGSDNDSANGIAVDGSGNAYVAGVAQSTDFPTANALQGTSGGGSDAFVAKLTTSSTATQFSVSAPASATAGSSFSFTVTALDAFSNVDVAYSGTVHFTGSDGAATLPADATLTNGVGTFSATLGTAGNQTITATDTVTSSITGTSNPIAVSPASATHFSVSAPATANAGSAFSFTVTALDAFNNTATGYGGTVQFTSSDGAASLPANATLTNGVGTFPATLRTAGNQTITATDTVTPSISGTSNTIAVSPASATHFSISAPASANAGSAFSFTVTALDAFNNTATSYGGTVHFTSSDGAATLPANATLTNGAGTFSATLGTAGNQTITATDTVTASITGTSNTIAVSPANATHFSISAPATANAGSAFSFTVTALDAFNNTATGYGGTVHFTSSDGAATLPPNAALTNGAGTFSATFGTAGNQTITATDTVTASVTGTSNATAVSSPDLGITNTASPGPYGTGLPITYTIVVSNGGAATASAVTVTDAIPAGTAFVSATSTQGSCSGTSTVTCTIGSLVAGDSATISLKVSLPSNPGTVSNTAMVSSSIPDPTPANNTATATVVVIPSASIPTLSWYALMLLAAAITAMALTRLR